MGKKVRVLAENHVHTTKGANHVRSDYVKGDIFEWDGTDEGLDQQLVADNPDGKGGFFANLEVVDDAKPVSVPSKSETVKPAPAPKPAGQE